MSSAYKLASDCTLTVASVITIPVHHCNANTRIENLLQIALVDNHAISGRSEEVVDNRVGAKGEVDWNPKRFLDPSLVVVGEIILRGGNRW